MYSRHFLIVLPLRPRIRPDMRLRARGLTVSHKRRRILRTVPLRRVGPWSGALPPGRWGSSQLPRLCRATPPAAFRGASAYQPPHSRNSVYSAPYRQQDGTGNQPFYAAMPVYRLVPTTSTGKTDTRQCTHRARRLRVDRQQSKSVSHSSSSTFRQHVVEYQQVQLLHTLCGRFGRIGGDGLDLVFIPLLRADDERRERYEGPHLGLGLFDLLFAGDPAMVSWNDAQAFVARLNEREGHSRYRLPTEAEWEYAARAGSTTRYGFGNDAEMLGRYAWYGEDFENGSTHPVGQKESNAWGLYDMHGNVWEWVWDWYDARYYAHSPAADPTGPQSGSKHVVRGGSWHETADDWRSAFRRAYPPDYRGISIGFRPILVLEQE